ncbi:tellurite resistance TerB family protein [Aureimonas psammosilenae]|uniref:tellurite resistance TerB family protein n=1 Tax=Aureimonas psammosilenae TaxID=2495496 RepID=UPI0012608DDE|nr:TerB family tellurite resistance protein [Aureimonas psammosilenae]
MFEALKDFLRSVGLNADGRPAPVRDPRVAAAALLCHVAEADGVVSDGERRQLVAALATEFGLSEAEATSIARAGREADAEAVDLFHFTGILMHALSEEQRVRFVSLLWEVVYSDGKVHELEDNVIWRIAELLGVSTRERMLAKRAVLGREPADETP